MYCTKCGKLLQDGDRFCIACGADQQTGAKPPASKQAIASASPALGKGASTSNGRTASRAVKPKTSTTLASTGLSQHGAHAPLPQSGVGIPLDDNEALVKKATATLIGILASVALIFVLLFVIKVGPFAPVAQASTSVQTTPSAQATASAQAVASTQAAASQSDEVLVKSAASTSQAASDGGATAAWFGSTRTENGTQKMTSLKGIEGSYVDFREGPTDGHGFYELFRITDATVDSSGLAGTCNVEMRWLSQTNLPIQNDVATFNFSMSVSFAPSNPDVLICMIEGGGDSIQGKATLTNGSFKWVEGWMLPRFVYEPDRKVDLTRSLKRGA